MSISGGDADVLNGLIVVGVAIGLAALFMPFREKRDLPRAQLIGLATFELFAAVAIFSCAFLTVFLALSFLEEGKPLAGGDLRATVTPVAVAGTVLLFLTVFARLPEPLRRAVDQIPLMLGAWMLALALGFVMVFVPADQISIAAMGLLVVGAAIATLAWALADPPTHVVNA